MDRIQAFTEYGKILGEFEDSITGGFLRARNEVEIQPPVRSRPAEPVPHESSSLPDLQAPQRPVSIPVSPPQAGPPTGGIPVQVQDSPETVSHRIPVNPVPEGELGDIASEIAECRNCNLYLMREQTVPGIGRAGCTLMIVTAPPTDTAGSLSNPLPAFEQEYLNRWLLALGLDPGNDIFITPSVKCRTPGSRPPGSEEAAACAGYLRRQYKAAAPAAVLALGASACGALTGNPADFPSLVGRDWTWGAVPALVLWSPAEVLANPGKLRAPVWDSLQRLKAAWNAVPGSQL